MAEKDVHTEHCCVHVCKYNEDDCTVRNLTKEQSFPCKETEVCWQWNERTPDKTLNAFKNLAFIPSDMLRAEDLNLLVETVRILKDKIKTLEKDNEEFFHSISFEVNEEDKK